MFPGAVNPVITVAVTAFNGLQFEPQRREIQLDFLPDADDGQYAIDYSSFFLNEK